MPWVSAAPTMVEAVLHTAQLSTAPLGRSALSVLLQRTESLHVSFASKKSARLIPASINDLEAARFPRPTLRKLPRVNACRFRQRDLLGQTRPIAEEHINGFAQTIGHDRSGAVAAGGRSLRIDSGLRSGERLKRPVSDLWGADGHRRAHSHTICTFSLAILLPFLAVGMITDASVMGVKIGLNAWIICFVYQLHIESSNLPLVSPSEKN